MSTPDILKISQEGILRTEFGLHLARGKSCHSAQICLWVLLSKRQLTIVMGLILLQHWHNTIRAVWHGTGYFLHERKLIPKQDGFSVSYVLWSAITASKTSGIISQCFKISYPEINMDLFLVSSHSIQKDLSIHFSDKNVSSCNACYVLHPLWNRVYIQLTVFNRSIPAPRQFWLAQWWRAVPLMDLDLTVMIDFTDSIFH